MNLEGKKDLVKEYKEIFSQSTFGVLIDHSGHTVEEITNFRKKIQQCNGQITVIKNTLAKRAIADTPYQELGEYFVNPRSLVYTKDNPFEASKIFKKEIESTDSEKAFHVIQGILMEGKKARVLSKKEILMLGSLPSREELLSKLCFVLNSPTQSFACSLKQIITKLVIILKNITDKQ